MGSDLNRMASDPDRVGFGASPAVNWACFVVDGFFRIVFYPPFYVGKAKNGVWSLALLNEDFFLLFQHLHLP